MCKLNWENCDLLNEFNTKVSNNKGELWDLKYIKDNDERIEIRKTINDVQFVIIVFRNKVKDKWKGHDNIQISSNGKVQLSYENYLEMNEIVEKSITILKI